MITPYHFCYVYILKSVEHAKLYIGYTNDLRKRLTQHNNGESTFTSRFMPWQLIYYEAFSDKKAAQKRELSLKRNGNPMRELKKRIGIETRAKVVKGGFTLLETIIYIGLFSMLMTGVLVTVYELIEGGTQNRRSIAIQEEGSFVNRKISWALSGATAVSVSGGGKTLTITRPDLAAQNPLVLNEDVDGQMTLTRGVGTAPSVLTTNEFKVSHTSFSTVPTAYGLPTSVRVSYEIDGMPFVFKTYLRDN